MNKCVYIVMGVSGIDYEGEDNEILGVYSSIENAVEEANKYLERQERHDGLFDASTFVNHDSVNYGNDDGFDYNYVEILFSELDAPIKLED